MTVGQVRVNNYGAYVVSGVALGAHQDLSALSRIKYEHMQMRHRSVVGTHFL